MAAIESLTINVLADGAAVFDSAGPIRLDAVAEIDLAGIQMLIAARRSKKDLGTPDLCGAPRIAGLRDTLRELGLIGRPVPNPDEAADEAMWESLS